MWIIRLRGDCAGFGVRGCSSGTYLVGSPATEPGRDNDEVEREVTLSRSVLISQTSDSTRLASGFYFESYTHQLGLFRLSRRVCDILGST